MSDIHGHRASHFAGDARRTTIAGARPAALILIAVSLAVWISNRPWSGSFGGLVSADRIREVIVRAGLQPAGNFQERITGFEGVEILRPGCPAPTAILPVTLGTLELPPDGLTYRDGDYDVAYAFDGGVYPEQWVSYRLRITSLWRRLASIVTRSDKNSLHYYMKIWTPQGCASLTSQAVERLRDAD